MKKLNVEKLLTKARSYAKKGKILDAQKFYQDVLDVFPANLRAQQGLASLKKLQQNSLIKDPPHETINQLLKLFNQRQFVLAVDQAQMLTKHYPDSFLLWNILGISNAQIGNLKQAVFSFEKAINIKPEDAEAFYNLGNALHSQGKLDSAIEAYRKALFFKADYAEAYNNIGIAFKDQGKLCDAIAEYKKALAIAPEYAEVYKNMGISLKDLGRLEEAIDAYAKVLLIKPNDADAYYNMGNVFYSQGKKGEAIECYKKSLALEPNNAKAHNNIGNSLKDQGKFEDAISAFEQALLIKPDDAEIHNNMGNALRDNEKLDESIEAYKKATALAPDFSEAYFNMGNALLDQVKLDEAIELYNKSLSLNSSFTEASYNKGLAKLKKQDFKTGFELYNLRFNSKDFRSDPLIVSKPVWTGQRNKILFLWAEQGLGDEIMFASLIPEVAAVASKVIVQCDERLIPLFKRSFDQNIVYQSNRCLVSETDYDFHIPIGSLPSILRPSKESFESSPKEYLYCQKNRLEELSQLLVKKGKKSIIGISWSSASVMLSSKRRSIPLETLACLLDSPETMLVSLQYGNVSKEITDLKINTGIEVTQLDQVDNKNDIDGLATLISACNHVVSIDNSTVHLAGALGKSTKVLLPFASDWRWGKDQSNSYWYPSLTLYRQKDPNVWDYAFHKLVDDLRIK